LPLARPEGGTLAGQEPYHQAIARLFGVDTAATMTTASLTKAQMAVSRLSSGRAGIGLTSPLPVERATLLVLHLADCPRNALWKAGRRVAHEPFVAGSIVVANLADEPCIDLQDPFECLLMHIPQIVFDEMADDHGAPRISALQDQAATPDPIVHHLARALLPALASPDHAPQLFFDHVAFAIYARLAKQYGRLSPRPDRTGAGCLSAQLERLAKEALVSDLTQVPALGTVARACNMPVNRFVRAFRQTTGMPPFRWLRAFRVERAKDLLLNSQLALAEIAYDCGFADQSHFTRVFIAAVGTTPGAWRSARR
jgi:AraC-like DNA-binding protein